MPAAPSGGGGAFAIVGWIVGAAGFIATVVVSWRKGGVDQSAMLFKAWSDIKVAQDAEIASLTTKVGRLESRLDALEEENHQLRQERDQALQISRSTAALLARGAKFDAARLAELLSKLDNIGHNSIDPPA